MSGQQRRIALVRQQFRGTMSNSNHVAVTLAGMADDADVTLPDLRPETAGPRGIMSPAGGCKAEAALVARIMAIRAAMKGASAAWSGAVTAGDRLSRGSVAAGARKGLTSEKTGVQQ